MIIIMIIIMVIIISSSFIINGEMRGDDTEILFQTGLSCAADDNLSMGKDVHSCTLSLQLFFLRLRRRPQSSMPLRTVLHRESCLVTCPTKPDFVLRRSPEGAQPLLFANT
ncbi:hypothetical protein DPMN_015128 [Dreissena polymorpha]|uniref:Secreted protein n=1 Tax=Dreissena polymorpha TaxID=45954 RepID=A0A9D4N778_DREPO|nr:hypothetical protein DPMN_015128 [Dreissena polymorpha]